MHKHYPNNNYQSSYYLFSSIVKMNNRAFIIDNAVISNYVAGHGRVVETICVCPVSMCKFNGIKIDSNTPVFTLGNRKLDNAVITQFADAKLIFENFAREHNIFPIA
jgi:hypothetical protein